MDNAPPSLLSNKLQLKKESKLFIPVCVLWQALLLAYGIYAVVVLREAFAPDTQAMYIGTDYFLTTLGEPSPPF